MTTTTHPWITELSVRLDALEAALLSGDGKQRRLDGFRALR